MKYLFLLLLSLNLKSELDLTIPEQPPAYIPPKKEFLFNVGDYNEPPTKNQIILFWYITFGQVGELLSVSEQQLVDCAKGSCSVSSFFVLNIIISNCYYPAVWDVNATIWFWDQTINHTTARCFAGTFFWKSTAKMSFCSLMTILGRQHGKRLGQSKGRDYECRGLYFCT